MGERHGDGGAALITVLLTVLVLVAVSVVFVGSATSESRATANEQHYQSALHAAEAGADRVLARVKADSAYATGQTWSSPSDVRAWAISQRASADRLTVPGGEAYGLRPSSGGTPVQFVLGVGTVAGRTRVVRLDIGAGPYRPTYGLLTQEGTLLYNQATINGDVHTNGNLALRNNVAVTGSATYSGTLSRTNDTSVGSSGQATVPMPSFQAQDLYGQYASVPAGQWRDLCPDRTVRSPSASGPCSGPILASNLSGTTYQGLRYDSSAQRWISNYDGSRGTVDIVLYVHEGSISFGGTNGASGTATVLASASTTDNGQSGNILLPADVIGPLRPKVGGVLFVADRDLRTDNDFDGRGFVGVGEQIWLRNTFKLTGALVALGRSSTSSLVTAASPSGSGACRNGIGNQVCANTTITYDATLSVPFGRGFALRAWQEL